MCAVPSRLLGVTPRDSETTILLRAVRTICKWDIFTYRCNNLREVKCEEAVLERLDGPPQLRKPMPALMGRGQASEHATETVGEFRVTNQQYSAVRNFKKTFEMFISTLVEQYLL